MRFPSEIELTLAGAITPDDYQSILDDRIDALENGATLVIRQNGETTAAITINRDVLPDDWETFELSPGVHAGIKPHSDAS